MYYDLISGSFFAALFFYYSQKCYRIPVHLAWYTHCLLYMGFGDLIAREILVDFWVCGNVPDVKCKRRYFVHFYNESNTKKGKRDFLVARCFADFGLPAESVVE